ncbi:hypothetical protein WJX75_002873 [Coccomyxa subellipsoidea]|uniref:Uncharacterized protein n=1 Tax=Coccomyxa subellipsoidea TaxID=248742 RepID=A0ABR2Z3I5_9CHLO
MSPSAVTVVKPDGQVQAVLNLAEGNSTIRIQPSATSTGFITISQPNGPSAQVSLVPRPTSASAPAPSVPAELRTDLGLMPKSYDFSGPVTVDVTGGSSGSVFVDVRPQTSTSRDPH